MKISDIERREFLANPELRLVETAIAKLWTTSGKAFPLISSPASMA